MTLDAEQRELFRKGLEHATAAASGPSLDAALADMGWADALELDPYVAVGGLFEAQGRAGATSRALDGVLADALGVEPGAFVVPAMGRGLVVGGLEGVSRVYVADDGGLQLVDVAGLSTRAVRGIDPALGLVEVVGAGAPIFAPAGVAAAQRAVSHELIGASRAMLELAREHALDRVQFGQPIAGFQAIRHKLAETLVAIEAAAGALDASWDDGTPFAAMVAKGIAGKAARVTAKHCQQVLAGIGFTEEHAFHGYLRRTRVLDQLFGDSRTLTSELGAHLLEQRAIPPMLPL
jgi:alkylation response protein AidB-like acyl-CoA dehydrogenase